MFKLQMSWQCCYPQFVLTFDSALPVSLSLQQMERILNKASKTHKRRVEVSYVRSGSLSGLFKAAFSPVLLIQTHETVDLSSVALVSSEYETCMYIYVARPPIQLICI